MNLKLINGACTLSSPAKTQKYTVFISLVLSVSLMTVLPVNNGIDFLLRQESVAHNSDPILTPTGENVYFG